MSAQPLRSIEDQEYYHGPISRDAAEAALKVPGDFLVRFVDSNGVEPASYVVSVAMTEKREEKKEGVCQYQVKHLVVQKINEQFTLDGHSFSRDVIEIIERHLTGKHPIPNSSKDFFKTPIKRQSWDLLHEWIELGDQLGAGQFGVVCKATLKVPDKPPRPVAVKVAKPTNNPNEMEKVKEMLDEARVMRDFNHPNVVSLLGVANDREPLMIVMEFMPLGDIKTYLEKNKVSVAQKTKIVLQTGQGIAYLHQRKCIHRDIAARNVLATGTPEALEVKISDFGLAREGDRYKIQHERPLPVRWLAPEVLLTQTFEIRSDVWSFAQTVVEIYADGQEPYNHINKEQARDEIKQFRPPKMVPGMPEKMYELLVKYAWVPLKERQPMGVLIECLHKTVAMTNLAPAVPEKTVEEKTKMQKKGTNSERRTSMRCTSKRGKNNPQTKKKKMSAEKTTPKKKK